MHTSSITPSPVAIVVLVAATILFCLPLITNPALPDGSDASFHAQWTHGFLEALDEGVTYPRWIADSNRGFGAPTFVYYGPLPYFGMGLASLVTSGVIGPMRMLFIAAAFLSALAFYVSTRDISSELGSLSGSVLYLFLPYHVLDLYDRFAVAEYVSFIFFPLLFFGVRRLMRRPSVGTWILLAVSFSGLLLTHVGMSYIIVLAAAPYALVHAYAENQWRRLLFVVSAGGGALLCSAIYLIPLIAERELISVDWLVELSPFGNWQRNFIYRNEVEHGFIAARIKPLVNNTATYQAMLTAAAAILLWFRFRRSTDDRVADVRRVRREGWIWFAIAAGAFFLQTPLSSPLWSSVPGLSMLLFPWRFSALQVLGASVLVAVGLNRVQGSHLWQRAPAAALWVVAFSLPALIYSTSLFGLRPYTLDDNLAASLHYRHRVVFEYIPSQVENWQAFDGMPLDERNIFLSEPGDAQPVAWQTHYREVRVDTSVPNRLRFKTFSFPGWVASIDGEAVEIRSDNPYRLNEVEVPPGSHDVVLRYKATWDQQLGAVLSGLGVVLLIGAAIFRRPGEGRGPGY